MILPEFLREHATTIWLHEGIRELEGFAEAETGSLTVSWPSNLVAALQRLPIYRDMVCVEAWKPMTTAAVNQVLDSVRNRLLRFTLELELIDPKIGEAQTQQTEPVKEKIQNLFYKCIIGSTQLADGGKVTVFDQRYQQVDYQYNAAGDINIEAVQNQTDFIDQLRKLVVEVQRAAEHDVLDQATAVEVNTRIGEAITEAEKPKPDKKSLLDHIGKAKPLLEDAKAAVGLATALMTAYGVADKLF